MITAAIINNNHSLSTQNATQTKSHHDGKDLLPGARSIEFFLIKIFEQIRDLPENQLELTLK